MSELESLHPLVQFTKQPLPDRMRAAADVLTEVDDRQHYGQISAYGRQYLLKLADRWEREDAEVADKERQIMELVQVLRNAIPPTRDMWQHAALGDWTAIARTLIDQGWKKGNTDDAHG